MLSPVGKRLLKFVDKYWGEYAGESELGWNDLAKWLEHYAAPKDTHLDAMQQLCYVTEDVEVTSTARDILNRAVEKDVTEQIEGHLESSDEVDVVYLRDLIEGLEEFRSRDLTTDKFEVETDIENVLENSHITDDGLPFSLDCLQRAVGPLRPGDTVYVPARPEVGKTTFLVHQTGYMIASTEDTNAVIISNEEDGNRVMIRLYQSVLGWTTKDIINNPAKAKSEYISVMGSLDRVKIVHAAGLHKRDVERVIEKYDPSLVVFNMLSKISGFGSSRVQNDVDVYSAQGVWMRELANGFGCAAMTAWQAGGSAHGKAWVEQDDMYGSKTGIVAEADVILGIGKLVEHGSVENHRYIHLSKNKLPGDSKTDEKLRHGYFDDVYIDTERGRYFE
jgi:hypothetical protein